MIISISPVALKKTVNNRVPQMIFQTVEQQFKVDLPFRVYMMYFYVLAFVITLLKNLRILAPLTSNSAVTTYLSVFLFFAYFVWDPLVSHKPFGDDDGVALFIITVFFLMEILNMQSLNLVSTLYLYYYFMRKS